MKVVHIIVRLRFKTELQSKHAVCVRQCLKDCIFPPILAVFLELSDKLSKRPPSVKILFTLIFILTLELSGGFICL